MGSQLNSHVFHTYTQTFTQGNVIAPFRLLSVVISCSLFIDEWSSSGAPATRSWLCSPRCKPDAVAPPKNINGRAAIHILWLHCAGRAVAQWHAGAAAVAVASRRLRVAFRRHLGVRSPGVRSVIAATAPPAKLSRSPPIRHQPIDHPPFVASLHLSASRQKRRTPRRR